MLFMGFYVLLKNKFVYEGWSISLNVMVKYGREWIVSCLDNDAKVQVFF